MFFRGKKNKFREMLLSFCAFGMIGKMSDSENTHERQKVDKYFNITSITFCS